MFTKVFAITTKRRGCVWLFCMILAPVFSYGQSSDETVFTRQLWLDINPKWYIGENNAILTEFGYRTEWPQDWQRFVLRGTYSYDSYELWFKNPNVRETLKAGLGFFYLSNFESYNSLEVRPYQGYNIEFFIKENFVIGQLLRLEERILFNFDGNEPNQFGVRLRYQIKSSINIGSLLFSTGKGLYIPMSIELFFDMVKINQYNDVIRITSGLGYQFNSDFKTQFSLAYHYTQQELGGIAKTNDVVFRLSINKTIF